MVLLFFLPHITELIMKLFLEGHEICETSFRTLDQDIKSYITDDLVNADHQNLHIWDILRIDASLLPGHLRVLYQVQYTIDEREEVHEDQYAFSVTD